MNDSNENIRWLTGALDSTKRRFGYYVEAVEHHSLLKRLRSVMNGGVGQERLLYLLRKYGVSYRIESETDIFVHTAWIEKPLAEILDELEVPRTWTRSEFIEFFGPPHEFVGPPENYIPRESKFMIRQVTPSLLPAPAGFTRGELTVQPMLRYIEALPILKPLDVQLKAKSSDLMLLPFSPDLLKIQSRNRLRREE